MGYRWLVLAALVVAGLLYCRGPSASTVVSRTRLDTAAGAIDYGDVRFEAEWGEPVRHEGDIRRIGRARYKPAPFFTHHAVVTTGDFSDPDRVTVSRFNGGSIIWTAQTRPEGSLIVLHFVPADASVLASLKRLGEGDCARFSGREETDSHIKGSDGSWIKLTHDNHRYVLLEAVQACP